MNYKIYCNQKLIAIFGHELDRYMCFNFLKEKYPSSSFKKQIM